MRAAFNQVSLLSDAEKQQGVVTSSSGNFAQAAAYASKAMGVSCKIVMMRSSNVLKVARTQQLGGKVVFCKDRFSARQEKVSEIQQEERRAVIYPYDHPQTIAAMEPLP